MTHRFYFTLNGQEVEFEAVIEFDPEYYDSNGDGHGVDPDSVSILCGEYSYTDGLDGNIYQVISRARAIELFGMEAIGKMEDDATQSLMEA